MKHVTVLREEAVDVLQLPSNAVVIDATFGSGGHARAILEKLGQDAHYIGIDADPTALEGHDDLASSYPATVHLLEGNFREIHTIVTPLALPPVDAVLADLGWRMEQFSGETDTKRGFSFQTDEPLLMTYGRPGNYSFTAKDIVNDWAEEDIANVLYGYGEERFARRIARAITNVRKSEEITSAHQLADIVSQAVPPIYRHRKIHPATKTFQALRIAVNDEFDAIHDLIMNGFSLLRPGGRLAIISFHSLEDRIVKHDFQALVASGTAVLVHKKPLTASAKELHDNPRARSAKLRTIEKISSQ